MMKAMKILAAAAAMMALSLGSLRASTFDQLQILTGAVQNDAAIFGDSFGQVIFFHGQKLFVDAFLAQPDSNDVGQGAVYFYQHSASTPADPNWYLSQVIMSLGNLDHFGAVNLRAFNDWLFIPCIGTPARRQPNDIIANQDFKGSLQIYRLDSTGQYAFWGALDSKTPGLGHLAPCDPAVVGGPNPPPANTVEQGAAFGLSFDLLINENILVVGASTDINTSAGIQLINSGKVFVFQFVDGNWTLIQTILNPDGVALNDTFGGVVRTNGEFLAISNSSRFVDSHLHPYPNTNVYLFKFNSSSGQFEYTGQKIHGDQTDWTPYPAPSLFTAPPFTIADNFGGNMVFNDDYLIVSAIFEHLGSGFPLGAAYLYKLEATPSGKQLVRQAKFTSDDSASKFFGWDVQVDSLNAYVGDPLHTGPTGNIAQGAVLVFSPNSSGVWTPSTTLFNSSGNAYDFMGSGLGVSKIINSIQYFVAGTAKGDVVLFTTFLPIPPYLPDAPIPVSQDYGVVWQVN